MNKKQRRDKTVAEFYEVLQGLANRAYPDLTKCKRQNIIKPIFLGGLRNSIRDVVRYKRFVSLNDAYETATYVKTKIESKKVPLVKLWVLQIG